MKNNNKERQAIASETLKIIENRTYKLDDKTIDLFDEINFSKNNTKTYTPEALDDLLLHILPKKDFVTNIICKNCSTIEAIEQADENLKMGVLNFASAKNPGGGFLGGASAQEESLARASSLFDSLSHDMTLYNYNRSRETLLYSDYMIYSPKVIFWMNDAGEKRVKPIIADVITSPAPNKGAILQNNHKSDAQEIDVIFEKRIEKMLALAAQNEVEILILGAWGCGVFRNDPNDVARMFQKIIAKSFPTTFREIVYAIYDSSKDQHVLKAFENVFNVK